MTRVSVAAFALLIAIAGCKQQPPTRPVTKTEAQAKPAPAPAPKVSAEPAITDRESITVAGAPACAMSVTYPKQQEQPITWNGEDCAAITIAVADVTRLKLLRKWDKLSEETRDDIVRTDGKTLYIEGASSAAIYPLNVAGRVYDVPVAD